MISSETKIEIWANKSRFKIIHLLKYDNIVLEKWYELNWYNSWLSVQIDSVYKRELLSEIIGPRPKVEKLVEVLV